MISASTIALLIDAGLGGQTLKDITAAFERDIRNALRVTRGRNMRGNIDGNSDGNTDGNSDAGEPTPAALKMRKYREKQRLAELGGPVTEAVTPELQEVTSNNIYNISSSPEKEEKDIIVRKVTRPRNSYGEEFEKFWSEYPSDAGMSKKQAGAEWAKLNAEDRALAISALPHFKAWVRKQGDSYRTVHACRYLNQRRFDGFKDRITATATRSDAQVWVKRESDAGDAWDRWWKQNKGKAAPLDQNGGWYFPSEYPPSPKPKEDAA